MDGRTYGGWTDGHTDVQHETIIPRHYCVAEYKNGKCRIYWYRTNFSDQIMLLYRLTWGSLLAYILCHCFNLAKFIYLETNLSFLVLLLEHPEHGVFAAFLDKKVPAIGHFQFFPQGYQPIASLLTLDTWLPRPGMAQSIFSNLIT